MDRLRFRYWKIKTRKSVAAASIEGIKTVDMADKIPAKIKVAITSIKVVAATT